MNDEVDIQSEVTTDCLEQKNSPQYWVYRILFRKNGQAFSFYSKINNLVPEEMVMVLTEHGPEPAIILKKGIMMPEDFKLEDKAEQLISRRLSLDEINKFNNLILRESEAFDICGRKIEELKLKMKLISVERYFNGSKILFYFTADNRVDFRDLVKYLVQEFRTRVEMKQIGVRHETKMIGGLGCCGREFCCSSFLVKFAPVSIKMAKEQDLPLNPVKISGVCNRLLCCLTHEYPTYKALRKNMPKNGKIIKLEGKEYKVIQTNILSETITVVSNGEEGPLTLKKEQWQGAEFDLGSPVKEQKGKTREDAGEKKPAKKVVAKKKREPRPPQKKQRRQKSTKQTKTNK